LIQLIYRKSLLMVPTTESSSGQVVNLMSTDAQTLAEAVSLFNMGVVAPIQIICKCYSAFVFCTRSDLIQFSAVAIALIWLQIGPYALISIGVVIVVLPFNLVLGKKFSESRTLAQRDTDERVKLTNELLQAVRIVKVRIYSDTTNILIMCY
jgi:ABC-type multidrug transport system fused ATPase/permease subunit